MKSCKKSDEKYLRFGKGNSPGVFSLDEWFSASSTFLLSLLLGKLTFYLMELLRCVVIVAYLFLYLSRGEDARASASCPSSTTSKQAVRVVRGRRGFRSRG